jgi:hypothetical protein
MSRVETRFAVVCLYSMQMSVVLHCHSEDNTIYSLPPHYFLCYKQPARPRAIRKEQRDVSRKHNVSTFGKGCQWLPAAASARALSPQPGQAATFITSCPPSASLRRPRSLRTPPALETTPRVGDEGGCPQCPLPQSAAAASTVAAMAVIVNHVPHADCICSSTPSQPCGQEVGNPPTHGAAPVQHAAVSAATTV